MLFPQRIAFHIPTKQLLNVTDGSFFLNRYTKRVKWLALLLHIQDDPGSDPGYPDCFPSLLQPNAGTVPEIRPRPLPSIYPFQFTIHQSSHSKPSVWATDSADK
jgi:hypothetical protein